MSLVTFVAVALVGAALTVALRRWKRPAAVVGIAGLVATTVAALAIEPDQVARIASSGIATTAYAREFLILGSVVGLGLGLSGMIAGTRRDASAMTMAVLATSALTLGLRDPQAAVIAATAGGLFGVLVTVAPDGGLTGAIVGIREARIVVLAGVLSLAATAWFGWDPSELVATPTVLGLAYIGFAAAVAMRFGVIPFHHWAARVADTVPETILPLLTALAPASLALLASAWVDQTASLSMAEVGPARVIVLALAVGSIVLAGLAAFVQDDIEHVLGYSIVADAGLVILALVALDPAAWAPTRTWILVFIATRCAFAAWASGVRVGFWTGSLDDLQGWARRSPILAVVLVAIIGASVGVPGWAAFDARADIVNLAIGGPLATLILLCTLAPIAYYGRLLVVGMQQTDQVVRPVDDWRPRIPPPDRTDLLAWARTTARLNRAFTAAAVAVVLAGAAVAISAGVIGSPTAAAERPPGLERSAPDASLTP